MTQRTLTDLREQVRLVGDFENSSVFTDEFLNESVNKGIRQLHKIKSDAFEGYATTIGFITTVSGEQLLELPEDFYRLRALDRDLGDDRVVEISRVTLTDSRRHGGQGIPRVYTLHGPSDDPDSIGTVRVWPVPDNEYDLRITYDTAAPELEDDDYYNFQDDEDEYVIQYALMRCDQREERDIRERMMTLKDLEQQIRDSAPKRDSSGPEYLIPRNRGTDLEGDEW